MAQPKDSKLFFSPSLGFGGTKTTQPIRIAPSASSQHAAADKMKKLKKSEMVAHSCPAPRPPPPKAPLPRPRVPNLDPPALLLPPSPLCEAPINDISKMTISEEPCPSTSTFSSHITTSFSSISSPSQSVSSSAASTSSALFSSPSSSSGAASSDSLSPSSSTSSHLGFALSASSSSSSSTASASGRVSKPKKKRSVQRRVQICPISVSAPQTSFLQQFARFGIPNLAFNLNGIQDNNTSGDSSQQDSPPSVEDMATSVGSPTIFSLLKLESDTIQRRRNSLGASATQPMMMSSHAHSDKRGFDLSASSKDDSKPIVVVSVASSASPFASVGSASTTRSASSPSATSHSASSNSSISPTSPLSPNNASSAQSQLELHSGVFSAIASRMQGQAMPMQSQAHAHAHNLLGDDSNPTSPRTQLSGQEPDSGNASPRGLMADEKSNNESPKMPTHKLSDTDSEHLSPRTLGASNRFKTKKPPARTSTTDDDTDLQFQLEIGKSLETSSGLSDSLSGSDESIFRQ